MGSTTVVRLQRALIEFEGQRSKGWIQVDRTAVEVEMAFDSCDGPTAEIRPRFLLVSPFLSVASVTTSLMEWSS